MSEIRWAACIKVGCLYASSVFVIGFALGAVRVLLVIPHLGETPAVLLEAPLMLAVSWILSRWIAGKHGMLTGTSEAFVMGAIAFAILICAELGTAVMLFRKTVLEYVAGLGSVPGAIGLAAQLCFAIFPVFHMLSKRISSSG
ncbi:hypothetical protein [Paraburkholderia sp. EG304]|uniref:hypothetical protein n=1 Tax=Paraburkholderia sp. EG304 TaxID=3237015 RepID=UPI00397E8FAA